jgi:hypothetical protein
VNINMLRDADNDAGFYAAACGLTDAWRGAALYVSADGGANYSHLLSITNPSTMGATTDVLPDFTGGNVVDELSSVNVMLTHGSLSSTNRDGLLAGVNTAIIGDEIVHFRTATLEVDGSYTLTGFLRGRRGSEAQTSEHSIGERFVLASTSTMVRVPQETADIGIERLYKGVTDGLTLAGTSSQAFTNAGSGLKPYSVCHLGGGRNDADDVLIQWHRRTRISGEWRDGVDVPLGEETEAYTVEIWDAGYTTLKRTISATSEEATYSAADQTTDFGAPQATVYVRVYQLSATVGQGYPADATI